jgi:peptidoglycan/LPS O-acetylase OafA/YrhL
VTASIGDGGLGTDPAEGGGIGGSSSRRGSEAAPGVYAGGFRADIQGLRALAVSMVLIYHLYPAALPGGFVGVDVFFAISGYLITGHLMRSHERTGRIGLLDFWGRRARRLVPAAALVLAATWLMSRVALPVTRLPDGARQVRASALYFQNWVLARDAVDYLKSADAASPVQHFWSLSVEEQFYLVWPLLFVLVALIAGRLSRVTGRTVALWMALGVVTVSLAYSARHTRSNPAAAYFVTTTRIWELALGGTLSLLSRRLSSLLAGQSWLGWAGLGMITASGFALSGRSAFPGTVALLPVGGAVMLIASGSSRARIGTARLMSMRPLVFLGGISYSLYLWHWPVIVFWKAYFGGVSGVAGPAIVLVCVGLSWFTKVVVEDGVRLAPFIARHRGRSLATALAAVLPLVLVTTFILSEPEPGPWNGRLGPDYPGAAVLANSSTTVPSVVAVPPVALARQDLPAYEKKHCEVGQHVSAPKTCAFGDTVSPTLTVALVGDSTAGNWFPALDRIAHARHWELITDIHSRCPWTAIMTLDPGNDSSFTACHTWGVSVLRDLISTIKPDVVITAERPGAGTPQDAGTSTAARDAIAGGMASYWRQLMAVGILVVPIHETPEMYQNEPDCLSGHSASVRSCSVAASKAIMQDPPTVVATRDMKGGVRVIDMNPSICGPKQCAPVVGNVVVYRDSHHLTSTYSLTMAPQLEKKLLAVLADRSLD